MRKCYLSCFHLIENCSIRSVFVSRKQCFKIDQSQEFDLFYFNISVLSAQGPASSLILSPYRQDVWMCVDRDVGSARCVCSALLWTSLLHSSGLVSAQLEDKPPWFLGSRLKTPWGRSCKDPCRVSRGALAQLVQCHWSTHFCAHCHAHTHWYHQINSVPSLHSSCIPCQDDHSTYCILQALKYKLPTDVAVLGAD